MIDHLIMVAMEGITTGAVGDITEVMVEETAHHLHLGEVIEVGVVVAVVDIVFGFFNSFFFV